MQILALLPYNNKAMIYPEVHYDCKSSPRINLEMT